MDKKTRELAALVKLTAAAYAAEQSRMGGLKRQEAKLRTKIEALKPSRQYASLEQSNDPARRAGADILWQHWADGRRATLNGELARTLVAQARAKASLARTFGRREAIKKMHEDARAKAQILINRRAEKNG